MDPAEIQRECAAFEQAGIQHVVAAPWRSDIDSWLDSMDRLADLLALTS